MEEAKFITVSDLIRYGRAHTGSSSYPGAPIVSPQIQNPQPCPKRSSQALTPLQYPALLLGTLALPTLALNCPHKNCLQFSDDSPAAVCCDVVGLDLRLVGKKIHVLAWNFIPSKHLPGGFLEILKWKCTDLSQGLSQCSSLLIDSFRLVSGSNVSKPSNSRSYRIHGALELVSPVSVVPCSVNGSSSSNSVKLRGFLVRILACQCQLCGSKESRCQESVKGLHQRPHCHSFANPVFVYFCESAWCWHPAMTKLIGNVFTISGLKKKLVYIGKQESVLMFIISENSVLHLPRLMKKWAPFPENVVKGNGECGSYTGTVSNVYMQGMVVELDRQVLLLLTDQRLMPSHGLRVGAVISVRNVHFVNPKFSWNKVLVLGACFKTGITVESFSPLETGCFIVSKSDSELGQFIESLEVSTRLWVLHLVLCFQKKFSGILSTKKILGSKHEKGLVQMFASSCLPSSLFQERHDVLMEFSKHESCGCAIEPYRGNLKLVVPICTFLQHCEAIWNTSLQLNNGQPRSCGGKSYLQSKRKTFQSEELCVVLLGSLKISPSSGRLQLFDMTGSIDAIVPDLPSNWNPDYIVEVSDYSLTVEGAAESIQLGLPTNELFSFRSIYHCSSSSIERDLNIFVYFRLCNATNRNLLFYPTISCQDKGSEIEDGTFHLIHITRKFLPLQKFKGDSLIAKRCRMFAEAIVLPWYLFLDGKDGCVQQSKVPGDCTGGSGMDNAPCKRQKTDYASSRGSLGFKDNFSSASSGKSSSFTDTLGEHCRLRMGFSHVIPCLATIRGVNSFICTSSGILCKAEGDAKIKDNCKESVGKILLEFTSDSYLKYQLLQIGGFYLLKHNTGDPLCNIKKTIKVHMTSGTYFRSVSFSPEVITTDKASHNPSIGDSSLCDDEVLTKDEVLKVSRDSSVADVHLHLSSSLGSLLEIDTKELGKDLHVPVVLEENSGFSSGTETITTASGRFPGSSSLFPKGNLTTFCGDVIDVHDLDKGSCTSREEFRNLPQFGFSVGTKSFCIHASMAHQTVRIFGSLGQHLFPTGFGPGANATFHQILKFGNPNTLMLTPLSVIVLNSIRTVNEVHSDKCFNSLSSDMQNAASTKMEACSGVISELIQSSSGNQNQFRCRVVAVHVLVLEKRNRKCDDLKLNMHLKPLTVDIPLSCFVLDDGSSSYCCWANAERAATLLRLHELPSSAFEAIGSKDKWVGIQNTTWTSSMYHLQRIVEKYGRITVENTRSIFDSLDQDFAVSVSSGQALTGLDKDLYHLISVIFNACMNTFWTVVAGPMDSNAVNLLKEHLVGIEMPMPSMTNLWVREVCFVNQLTEARDMIRKLLTGNS